jgi:hypothetical protein
MSMGSGATLVRNLPTKLSTSMAHRSNYQLSGGHEMSIAGNYSFFGAPFIWTTLHGKKNVHLLSVLYEDDHFTKTGSG